MAISSSAPKRKPPVAFATGGFGNARGSRFWGRGVRRAKGRCRLGFDGCQLDAGGESHRVHGDIGARRIRFPGYIRQAHPYGVSLPERELAQGHETVGVTELVYGRCPRAVGRGDFVARRAGRRVVARDKWRGRVGRCHRSAVYPRRDVAWGLGRIRGVRGQHRIIPSQAVDAVPPLRGAFQLAVARCFRHDVAHRRRWWRRCWCRAEQGGRVDEPTRKSRVGSTVGARQGAPVGNVGVRRVTHPEVQMAVRAEIVHGADALSATHGLARLHF